MTTGPFYTAREAAHPLKLGQAAKRAGVHKDTMRRWCEEGVVVAWRVPAGSITHWRIDPNSIPGPQEDPAMVDLMRRAGI